MRTLDLISDYLAYESEVLKDEKILAVLLAAGLLGGCGQQSTTAATPASSSAASGETSSAASSEAPESSEAEGTVSQASRSGESKPHENGLLGRVTAIDGNVITMESMDGGKRPDGELRESARGNKGEKPADAPEVSGEEKPPMDQDKAGGPGTDKGEGPNGGEHGTATTGAPGNRETENVSVTLPDDCEILLERQGENTAGTTADIVVGSMIRITYAEDGDTVQTVTVMEDREPQEAQRPLQEAGTPEAAEQAVPKE